MRRSLRPRVPSARTSLLLCGSNEKRRGPIGFHPAGPIAVGLLLLTVLLAGCAGNRDLLLADEFGKQGRWDEAHQIYQEALRSDPANLELRERAEAVRKRAAQVHYESSLRLLERRNLLVALEEIKQAIALDPSREDFQSLLANLLRKREAREHLETGLRLVQAEKFSDAKNRLERARELDPELEEVRAAMEELARAKKRTADREVGLTLKSDQPITLKFQNAKLSEVFEFLAKSSGINILFDKDVRPEGVTVSIFIRDASFREALNLILTTNNLFMKKVSEETILVIPNNKQKLNQYEDLMIRTFYLSNVKAKDMINLLRTMLETRRIIANDEVNAIIMRDSPEKIRLAEKILEANDRRVAEVMFDVEILEVNRTDSLKFGWNFSPQQATGGIKPPPNTPGSTSGEISLEQIRSITDDLIFFTIPSIVVDFFKQQSDAKTLANPRIRVLDGKQAKINIGDRVPILLSTTTTAAASTGTVPTQSTATAIEFKDVGIKLNVEPEIHLIGDVTLKINLEVTSLGDLVDLGPQKQFRFGTRTAETILNVRDGEAVVIGGLIRDEERNTVNKVPGLGDIPLLGKLFSGLETSQAKVDVLMTLTPRLVHEMVVPDSDLQSFWSGTEDSYATRPLFSDLPEIERDPDVSGRRPAPTGGGAPSPTKGPEAGLSRFFIHPADGAVDAGGETVFEIRLEGSTPLSSGAFSIAFDPQLLTFKNGVAGALLSGPHPSRFTAASRPESGRIEIQIGPSRPEGIQGPGSLFTMVFEGRKSGAGQIRFQDVRLIDPEGRTLSVDLAPARVTVR